MSGDEALELSRSDPGFHDRYVRAYGGDDALEALRRYAADPEPQRLRAELAPSLYGRAADERDRRRSAARLERVVQERERVAAAVRAAGPAPRLQQFDPPQPEPAGATVDGAPDPAGHPAPSRPAWWLVAGGVAGTSLLVGGFLAGASIGTKTAAAPRPSALPTQLFYDDRDGQVARLAFGPGSSDRRAVAVSLPEMLRGWSVSMACLSRTSRPRVVPTETVLLLDDRERQIGHWRVPCDTTERRYVALPAPTDPRTVRLVLVLDEATVGSGWVTLDPTVP